MRTGIAGLASLYWPITLGNGLKNHPEVDFVAAATLGVGDDTITRSLGVSAQQYATDHGLKLYTDAESMIAEEQLDAVLLITPHTAHADWVERLAPLGVDLALPKTFATTLEQADRIVAAEKQCGIRIAVCPTARFLPQFAAVKQALDEDLIGPPFSMRLAHHHGTIDAFPADDWYRKTAEGGPELSLGWYGIDLVLHLMSDKVVGVSADYGNYTTAASPFLDCGHMLLKLARGGAAVFDMYFCNRCPYPSWQLELVGPRGVLSVHRQADSSGMSVSLDNEQGYQSLPLPQSTPDWEHFWIDELVHGGRPTVGAAEAREITQISLAAREAAKEDRHVDMREVGSE